MEKIDARKLSQEGLRAKREEVVSLHLEKTPVMKIVELTGMSWPTVNKAIKQYVAEGNSGPMPAQRGRKEGMGRILSQEQENEIRKILYRKRPYQAHITSTQTNKLSLWCWDSVMQLFRQKCKNIFSEKELSVECVAQYLERWGFPRTKKRRDRLCSKEIRGWLKEHYEELEQRAKSDNSIIYWISKNTVTTNEISEKSGKPLKLRMITATNNQGKAFWLIVKGVFSSDKQTKFIQNLIDISRGQRLLLIRCEAGYFTQKEVISWSNEKVKRVVCFPPILPKEQEAEAARKNRRSNSQHQIPRRSLFSDNETDEWNMW